VDAARYGGVSRIEARGWWVRRRAWLSVVVILAAAGVDVVANVAPLPESWTPYLWAAWPVLAVLLLVVVVVEVVHGRRGKGVPEPLRPEIGPGVVIQQVIESTGGTAQGALFGNVINHPGPVADTPSPTPPEAGESVGDGQR
jgi:hypothetical protein